MCSSGRQRTRDPRCQHVMRRAAGVVAGALLVSAGNAAAQTSTGGVQPEIRADMIAGAATSTEVAAGASFSVGDYLRLGGDVGIGATAGDGRPPRLASRIDALGRFQLDTASARWGPYLAAGVSYQADVDRRGALYLLAAIGVHAPAVGGTVPAIEVGIGGGVRAGLLLTFR